MSTDHSKHRASAPIAQPPQGAIGSQQKLLSLEVVRLKSLRDVSLDFSHSPLTAIMGSNCCGKTTVLHALACAHKPIAANGHDYQFPLFFRPNTDALWKESDFTVRYSIRIGANVHPELSQRYTKATDRWTPRYDKRPARFTRFISIGESVPDIETLTLNSMIHYTKAEDNDEIGVLVREASGQVLNRAYDNLYRVTYDYGGKLSIGVTTGAVTYSGLSMSSGEQRVFRILDAVFRAPKYGLILVDEIDLFLHQDALQRLLKRLQEHCEESHKQLIFTTHFPPVAQMYDRMCIYTLNRTESKTVVWRGYSYEAMRHITGEQERPISCYVEDDVAEQIVSRIATQVGIRRFVRVGRYGPAANAFSLCAGLLLSLQSTDHTLAILDGDVYGSRKERIERVKSAITGTLQIHEIQRRSLLRLVRSFGRTRNSQGIVLSPEQVLHGMLHELARESIPADRSELYDIAKSVINVREKHDFINQIISHTGETREVALSKIVELASMSPAWERYTRIVRKWLEAEKAKLESLAGTR